MRHKSEHSLIISDHFVTNDDDDDIIYYYYYYHHCIHVRPTPKNIHKFGHTCAGTNKMMIIMRFVVKELATASLAKNVLTNSLPSSNTVSNDA